MADVADVLIAGGGIAGATLAVLLGRAGLRVEIYEERRFPREKPCGEGLMPAGVRPCCAGWGWPRRWAGGRCTACATTASA